MAPDEVGGKNNLKLHQTYLKCELTHNDNHNYLSKLRTQWGLWDMMFSF